MKVNTLPNLFLQIFWACYICCIGDYFTSSCRWDFQVTLMINADIFFYRIPLTNWIKMPPKKKAGAKKKAGKKAGSSKGPTVIDGLPVSEMSKEQLEGHVKRLQEEVRLFSDWKGFNRPLVFLVRFHIATRYMWKLLNYDSDLA